MNTKFMLEVKALNDADVDMQKELRDEIFRKVISPTEYLERVDVLDKNFREGMANILKKSNNKEL